MNNEDLPSSDKEEREFLTKPLECKRVLAEIFFTKSSLDEKELEEAMSYAHKTIKDLFDHDNYWDAMDVVDWLQELRTMIALEKIATNINISYTD